MRGSADVELGAAGAGLAVDTQAAPAGSVQRPEQDPGSPNSTISLGGGSEGAGKGHPTLEQTEASIEATLELTKTYGSGVYRTLCGHQPSKAVAVVLLVLLWPLLLLAAVLAFPVWLYVWLRQPAAASRAVPPALQYPLGIRDRTPVIEVAVGEEDPVLVAPGPGLSRATVQLASMGWPFPFNFDVGIYWYALGNRCSKGRSSGNFDASKPSVIYVHGWEPGTTQRGFRETVNWLNAEGDEQAPFDEAHSLDVWLTKGYNAGVFYWNQWSDEPNVLEAERKVYNAAVGTGMRWMRQDHEGQLAFVHNPLRHRLCASQVLLEEYLEHFSSPEHSPSASASPQRGKKSPVRQWFGEGDAAAAPGSGRSSPSASPLSKVRGGGRGGGSPSNGGFSAAPPAVHMVGHSLGSQLVLEFMRRLILDPRRRCVPERVTLLDPFFSKGRKAWDPLCGVRTASRAAESVNVVLESNPRTVIETYETSLAGTGVLGGSSSKHRLKQSTIYHKVDMMQFPWFDIAKRHVCAPHVYFCSKAHRGGYSDCFFNAQVSHEQLLVMMPRQVALSRLRLASPRSAAALSSGDLGSGKVDATDMDAELDADDDPNAARAQLFEPGVAQDHEEPPHSPRRPKVEFLAQV